MRCFIAIDIDDSIRRQIDTLQKDLRSQIGLQKPHVKWVEPELIHLTLKFLGEVKDDEIVQVCQIVSDTAAEHKGFSMDVKNLGFFGSTPRVLWVGIERNQALLELQQDLDQRLYWAGWSAENRQFSGHLTICRIKNTKTGKTIRASIENYSDLNLGSLFVDSLCVYKSDLTRAGPLYTLIAASSLQ